MKILVTGAKGFVGRNLCENLKAVRDGKNRTRPALQIEDVFEYDLDTPPAELDHFCAEADFVFNLAGVNRPKNNDEFMQGNFGFASTLLGTLKSHANRCPVMLSSSIQATLIGRYGESDYGKSKLAGEELFFTYGQETGAPVLVYRFPNLFGKWCRPNYNSAVATFCNNTANDLPITVNDRATELELLYIDDLVEGMFDLLEGKERHCEFDGVETVLTENGRYCCVPGSHKVTLGEIVDLLAQFKQIKKMGGASALLPYVSYQAQTLLYECRNSTSPFLVEIGQTGAPANVLLLDQPRRTLPSPIAVHLLGYLDQEGRGVTGLERAWDAVLANSCDQTAAVCRTTARGRLLGTGTPEIITEQQGTGAQVQLTLDADIQRLCEGLAQLYMPRGCILVMDTATGEVLASVSMPEYDPDDVARSIRADDTSLINRSLSAFSAGSSFSERNVAKFSSVTPVIASSFTITVTP